MTSILHKYVPEWMGEDALDGLLLHPPWGDLRVTA